MREQYISENKIKGKKFPLNIQAIVYLIMINFTGR
jgi:hypothetical protein